MWMNRKKKKLLFGSCIYTCTLSPRCWLCSLLISHIIYTDNWLCSLLQQAVPVQQSNMAAEAPSSHGPRNIDIIALDISMLERGVRGGLGISVKGRTAVREAGNRDVGLFVKSISAEGAAARVRSHWLELHIYSYCRSLFPKRFFFQ